MNAVVVGAAPSSVRGRYLEHDNHFGVGFDLLPQLIAVFLETLADREGLASCLFGRVFRHGGLSFGRVFR